MDTELGGAGQTYPTPTNGLGAEDLYTHANWNGPFTGNANSDMGQWRLPARHGSVYYNQLGLDPSISNVTRAYDNIMGWDNPNGRQAPLMQKMDYYQQLGQQMRSALSGPQPQQQQTTQQSAPLTTGYDMDWLSRALAAGSANGAHL